MTHMKWIRRALLGGAALSVMAGGAQADELTALKAQLEALQARVNTLEAKPAPTLPQGASYLTFERGQGSNGDWGNDSKRDSVNVNNQRGFTVSVTPTADLPAPVAEVTVYGYVKGDVIYDTDDGLFSRSFSGVGTALPATGNNDNIFINAHQSRFGIKSKVDTAIGQIRTKIEADFEGAPYGTNSALRLRHAYGEWDMTPNWTLLIGRYWFIGSLLPMGVSTVDFAGYLLSYSRNEQVRLTYHGDGPFTMAFAIEDPTFKGNTAAPNVGAYFQYDAPGGHQFVVTFEGADWDNPAAMAAPGNGGFGWVVQGGVNVNLGDMISLTGGIAYGEGLPRKYCLAGDLVIPTHNSSGNPTEMMCTLLGASLSISETVTINAEWSYGDILDRVVAFYTDDYNGFHVNLMWQPVKQMRMGWEVIYADFDNSLTGSHVDTVRGQFGAWFFF